MKNIAFPTDDEVPCTLACLGVQCYPKCGCCNTLGARPALLLSCAGPWVCHVAHAQHVMGSRPRCAGVLTERTIVENREVLVRVGAPEGEAMSR